MFYSTCPYDKKTKYLNDLSDYEKHSSLIGYIISTLKCFTIEASGVKNEISKYEYKWMWVANTLAY